MASETLGQFEQLILTALLLVGQNAYGVPIFERLETLVEGKRSVQIGPMYTTLDRLETKGYVRSWYSEPIPERGGKSKRYFEITGSGQQALQNSMDVASRMLTGLREIGGLA
jgi:DNA-binding PadR family transcriptional regulator